MEIKMNTVAQQQNSDLVWDLEKLNQHKRAMNFVKQFENRFCVFSTSVRQLYTNYSIFFRKKHTARWSFSRTRMRFMIPSAT